MKFNQVQKDISIVSTMTLIDPRTCNSNFQGVNLQKYDNNLSYTKILSTNLGIWIELQVISLAKLRMYQNITELTIYYD